MKGLDEAGLLRAVAKRLAKLIDGDLEYTVADVGTRPGEIEKVVLADDLVRPFEQAAQNQRGFRGQVDAFVSPPDALIRRIDAWRPAPSRIRAHLF